MEKTIGVHIVKKSRKEHICFACQRVIPKGLYYLNFFNKNDVTKKVEKRKLCYECTCVIKDSDWGDWGVFTVKEGGLSERLIPNCLRKKRDQWRKDFIAKRKQALEKKANESKI